ncbi:hypothetical protein CI105_03545 [Candidatus Izimaplasma bacterium ZiA1]|uniref:carboxymuconolactone decarboxylase family protein n=1 Tax=Candidatus Izimoplasma sp. ZiA1 TaxID=2024899 RepID=UPI000BAA8885|nr:hypothetical protein CI105_03545 [Candidatus Izimaplasma bacterium ZiA1]
MTKSMRVFRLYEQVKNIKKAAKAFIILKRARKIKAFNKKFKERIMLAVTEVNGCELCSFVHTKIALSSGMTEENIAKILNNDSTAVPENEAVGVMFGQNYAYSHEQQDPLIIKRLMDVYGFETTKAIVASAEMITMTNGMGISMHLFLNRLKFRRNKKSNLFTELINPILTIVLFPIFLVFYKISSYIKTQNNILVNP